jgi:hypothetical protein
MVDVGISMSPVIGGIDGDALQQAEVKEEVRCTEKWRKMTLAVALTGGWRRQQRRLRLWWRGRSSGGRRWIGGKGGRGGCLRHGKEVRGGRKK